jgi:lysozyme
MKISLTGLSLVKAQEGWVDHVYKDVAGHDTIGYGHLVKLGERFPPTIFYEQGELLLKSDLEWAEEVVTASVKVPLSQNQFDALVDFTFNEGEGHFKGSTLLKLLNESNYIGASGEFKKWVYANGEVNEDLAARREKERQLFLTVEG